MAVCVCVCVCVAVCMCVAVREPGVEGAHRGDVQASLSTLEFGNTVWSAYNAEFNAARVTGRQRDMEDAQEQVSLLRAAMG